MFTRVCAVSLCSARHEEDIARRQQAEAELTARREALEKELADRRDVLRGEWWRCVLHELALHLLSCVFPSL